MPSTSTVFDVSIKKIYASILRLSDDTSIVLSHFDELIHQIYQSAKWSEQNTGGRPNCEPSQAVRVVTK